MPKNPLAEKLSGRQVILASQSPRRKLLLEGLDIPFTIKVKEVEEDFPLTLQAQEIALYLSEKKAMAYAQDISANELWITADTIVWHTNKVLNKPADKQEAEEMLRALSGSMHTVYTAVCLLSPEKKELFYDETRVYFKPFTPEEIRYYLERYNPLDKAGAYGAQEWIGYIGIEKIEGCYFNVMGLPVHKLYAHLMKFYTDT